MDNNLNKNLLVQIERISHEASKCNLEFGKMNQVKKEVSEVKEFLNISSEQTVIFSCMVELSLQRIVTMEYLARHLNCSVLKIIVIFDEIEKLEKRLLIKKKIRHGRKRPAYNDISYSVPHKVIESLRTSDKSYLNPNPKLNFPNLLEQIKITVKEREDEIISTLQLTDEVEFLLQNNREHAFIQYINKNLAKTTNKCVVLALAYYHLTGIVLMDITSIPEAIFDDINDEIEFNRSLASGNSELIRSGYVTVRHSGFANEQVLSLSQHSISILYQEYPELKVQEKSISGLIKHDSITEKTLFFEKNLCTQIYDIQNILKKKKFHSFQKAAQNSKLNKGITAIFYGNSGTGKTEAVYQIAKQTGRDIMMVDLSQTKSMWFGESEKQVKKIFDDYKQLIQLSSIEPILFINEVDGLFSRRLTMGSNASSSSQALNTIQNIILQELENFEGILLATTNLATNLDRAFERRFLFKVDFPKPDKFIRQKIWKSKLPELTQKMAITLGERYDLTGGQIDNQIRQLVLKRVLKKNLNLFDSLLESCENEKGFTKENIKVGF